MLFLKLFQITAVTAALQAPRNSDFAIDFVNCITANEKVFQSSSKDIVVVLPKLAIDDIECTRQLCADAIIRKLFKYKKRTFLIVNPIKGAISMDASAIQGYFLAFCRPEKFVTILEFLSQNQMINRRAYFVITSLRKDRNCENDRSVADKLAEVIYKYSIINAVLLVNDFNDEAVFNLYNFQYFRNKTCRVSPEKSVSKVNTCRRGKYEKKLLWYTVDIPKIFKSCELNVVYLDIPPYVIDLVEGNNLPKAEFGTHGLEVGVIANIFALMNVTLNFIKGPGLGSVFNNHTATGSFTYLVDNRAHVAIGGYSHTAPRFKMFDCGYPYYFESIAWAVPHLHVPVWDMANLIDYQVWIMIFLLISTVTSVIVILARLYTNESEAYRNILNTFGNVVIVANNLPVKLLPRSQNIRLVFSLLLLFALTFNAAYTTYLTSVFTNAARHKEKYDNLKDVIPDNLTAYVSPNGDRFFRNNNTLSHVLLKHAKLCQVHEYHRCLTEVAVHHNACLLGQGSFLNYIRNNYISDTQRQLIRVLPRDVSYPVTFIMTKGFWGFARVNKLLEEAMASGLAIKWMQFEQNPRSPKTATSSTELALSFENTVILFAVMLVGYLLGLAAFCIELILDQYQKRKHRFEYIP